MKILGTGLGATENQYAKPKLVHLATTRYVLYEGLTTIDIATLSQIDITILNKNFITFVTLWSDE